VRARRAISDGRRHEDVGLASRPALTPPGLYRRGALLSACLVSKLDTMPQEGTFMERPFCLPYGLAASATLCSPHPAQKVAKST